mmetsp:Transcript_18702/g.21071  ORF Transcript_18702/g.21071 Transcript_18702/m.21071 type:complete len:176 (+) Transcript_18702:75-602(+)
MMNEAATNYNSIPAHEGSKGIDGESGGDVDGGGSKMTTTSSTPSTKNNLIKVGIGAFGAFGLIGVGIVMMKSSTSTLLPLEMMTNAVVKTDVQGVHCCSSNPKKGDGKVPGNDKINCIYRPSRSKWQSDYCGATTEYEASHPNDPCGFAGVGTSYHCCPKSNSDNHIAYVFGGCA